MLASSSGNVDNFINEAETTTGMISTIFKIVSNDQITNECLNIENQQIFYPILERNPSVFEQHICRESYRSYIRTR